MTDKLAPDSFCPCGSTLHYQQCCQPFHLGEKPATAEQLMRSRYTAYALELIDYLVTTTHPDKCSKSLAAEIAEWAAAAEFTALEILKTSQGSAKDKQGKVEFIAHYQHDGESGNIHELSRFRRYQGAWKYLDGTLYQD